MNRVIDLGYRLSSMSAEGSCTNFFFDAPPAGRGGNGDVPISNCKGLSSVGQHRAERPWVQEQELPLGSHLVTPRCAYVHHGIYVGDGKVVHYAGLAHGLRRGPVEEISLARFTNGHPVCVRSDVSLEFDRGEVTRRARSRVGEDHYRLLTNNCEHFCEWCLYGEQRSYQVEEWLARPVRALHAAIRFIAELGRTVGISTHRHTLRRTKSGGRAARISRGSTPAVTLNQLGPNGVRSSFDLVGDRRDRPLSISRLDIGDGECRDSPIAPLDGG